MSLRLRNWYRWRQTSSFLPSMSVWSQILQIQERRQTIVVHWKLTRQCTCTNQPDRKKYKCWFHCCKLFFFSYQLCNIIIRSTQVGCVVFRVEISTEGKWRETFKNTCLDFFLFKKNSGTGNWSWNYKTCMRHATMYMCYWTATFKRFFFTVIYNLNLNASLSQNIK